MSQLNGYCFNPTCQEPQQQAGLLVCPRCGSSLWLANRYRAVRLLGQGGQSRTFLALDQAYIPPRLCVVKQVWGTATCWYPISSLQGLVQEKVVPHLPQVIEQFDQNGVYYRVQDYIAGETLAEIFTETGNFQTRTIWNLLEQLLPALQQLHNWGIIHGDIKPENIRCRALESASPASSLDTRMYTSFVGEAGEARLPYKTGIHPSDLVLVDGGIAKPLAPALWETIPAIGSSGYAAPEQLKGKPLFASDLYSLGATCVYLLTGMHPFLWMNSGGEPQIDWQQFGQGIDPFLATFLDRLITSNLSDRPPSAGSALSILQSHWSRPQPAPSISTPSPWSCYATLSGHNGLFANINAVAIAPDGDRIASASDDKTIRLWGMKTGQSCGALRGHSHFVKSVAFHPQNSNYLVSGGRDRTLHLWDLQTQQLTQTLTGHKQGINVVLFSPDGSLIASGSADKTIKLWDFQTGATLTTLEAHTLAVTALAFGRLSLPGEVLSILASASADSTVRIWDLRTGESRFILTGHTGAVRAIAVSADNKWLATGSEDRTIRLWDMASQQCLRILEHSWALSALAFAADSKTLMSGSWDKTVKVWQVESGQNIAVLAGHIDSVSSVAIAPDQQHIVSGSYDRTLKLWEFKHRFRG